MKVERVGKHTWQDNAYVITCNGYERALLLMALHQAGRRAAARAERCVQAGAKRRHATATRELKSVYDVIDNPE